MQTSLDARRKNANKGRPLTEKHKRALREGKLRAKILRELAAAQPSPQPKDK